MPKHRASGPQPPLPSRDGPRCHLAECYAAALRAVDGRAAVRGALAARPPSGPVWLIAVGKAAAAMTLGALDVLGSTCQGGLLVDKAAPLDPRPYAGRGIECLTGGHPVPTQASLDAGDRLLRALARTPRDTTLLFLLSGGGSSLVEVPVAGLGLVEIQRLNQWLLGSGWPITSMNRVRTAVSRIKGGGLLAALPDRPVRVLAISDVPNDAPAVIGSGLLVPALDLATQVVRLDLPAWLRDCVNQGLA
ncbi:MAG TPA: glycerate-2-kinase family protein, partial [Lamprocystis sp. (in: g-proteobacteria)]|nr:glycerate-2-kinase family protein [Lamprocystis sp. (in: g-proteobacteria)]